MADHSFNLDFLWVEISEAKGKASCMLGQSCTPSHVLNLPRKIAIKTAQYNFKPFLVCLGFLFLFFCLFGWSFVLFWFGLFETWVSPCSFGEEPFL